MITYRYQIVKYIFEIFEKNFSASISKVNSIPSFFKSENHFEKSYISADR